MATFSENDALDASSKYERLLRADFGKGSYMFLHRFVSVLRQTLRRMDVNREHLFDRRTMGKAWQ